MAQLVTDIFNNIQDMSAIGAGAGLGAFDAEVFAQEFTSKLNCRDNSKNTNYDVSGKNGSDDISNQHTKEFGEINSDISSNNQNEASDFIENKNKFLEKEENNMEEVSLEQLLTLAGQIVFPEIQADFNEINDTAEGAVSEVLLSEDASGQMQAEEVAETVLEEVVANTDDNFGAEDFGLDEGVLQDLNIEEIQTGADTNSGESFQQQQSAEEYGIKVMLQHSLDSSNINFDSIQSNVSQVKAVHFSAEKIIEQINKQMEGLYNGSKVNIVLNPESLGRVNLQLINTKEGLAAQFTVTTQEARELIMKGLDGLKSSLLGHGINVDNITVKISETEKETYNPDWTEQEGSRGGNKEEGRSNREEKEKGLFERTIAKTIEEEGKV